jgi:hypothetical protein
MSTDARIERVVTLTERLTEALEADIAALERARPAEMRIISPEMQQLAALYARESATLRPQLVKTAAHPLHQKLVAATDRFRTTLASHGRLLARLRRATEGMIRAVAEEVERKRSVSRPYAPNLAATRPPGALLYNGVA